MKLTPVGGLDVLAQIVGDIGHGCVFTFGIDERSYTDAVCGRRGKEFEGAELSRLLIVLLVQLERLLPNEKSWKANETTKAKPLQFRLSRAEAETQAERAS